uniref:CRC domain-containing protein n=2 Tax=Mesocestoides corti TaxID=53468 RepID=A0A5K3F948_MESCO
MLTGGATESALSAPRPNPTSTTQAPPDATVTAASHLPSQQQQQQPPPIQPRRVRDELDPAPHHTAADIRVLEILKRIRDSGGVGDDDLDPPPPKRKPGRTRSEKSTPARPPPTVLPQPQPTTVDSSLSKTTSRLETLRPRASAVNAAASSSSAAAAAAAATPSQLKNGLGASSTVVLATTNGTPGGLVATPVVAHQPATAANTPAIAVLQQKHPQQQQQQQFGLEIILPNGLRIPVSATCAQAEPKPDSLSTRPPPTTTTAAATATTTSPTTTTAEKPTNKSPSEKSASAQQICSCSRSKCLKLYCDCFAAGRACGDSCNCRHCYNNLADDVSKQTRDVAMRTALSRNPLAFKPKIENSGKHVLGCRCKRSHCMKGYCECYLARIPCNQRCRCLGCSNEENTPNSATTVNTAAATTATTNATPVKSVEVNNHQISWLASLAARQQIVTSAATNATVSVPATLAGATRTITLNVPIKALTTANGTGLNQQAQRQMATSTPDIQSLLLQPSYITAPATTTTLSGHDLLKCLNTVLPAQQPQQFLLPNVIQSGRHPAATITTTNATVVVDASTSKLSVLHPKPVEKPEDDIGGGCGSDQSIPLVSLSAASAEAAESAGEEEEALNVAEPDAMAANEDDYSGYTEEELAFMQRLHQDRNTLTSASRLADQIKPEDAFLGDDEVHRPQSSSVDHHSGHSRPVRPLSLPSPIFDSTLDPPAAVAVTSTFSSSVDHFHPFSAPASLCPPANHTFESCCHMHASLPANNVDVVQLQQKIALLESRVAKLMHVTQAQGSVLRSLAAKIGERQP